MTSAATSPATSLTTAPTTSPTTAAGPPRSAPAWRATETRVTLVCLAVGFATLTDQAVVTVAVPSLRASLEASTGQVQWLVAAYSLGFALALVPAGRLGDVRGRRGLLVGGVAVFSLLSVAAATATTADVAVACRFLQGVAAGVANPQVLGLLQDHFTGARRTRALGAYVSVAALAGILAPLVGGLVLEAAGGAAPWRWVVLLNVPFGLAAALLGRRWLPRVARPGRRPDVDPVGVALLGLTVLALLVPAVAVTGGTSTPGWTWGAPVLAGAALVVWERHHARRGGLPLLLPALLASRSFVLGTAVATLVFGASLGSTLVLVLHLQEGLGMPAWRAGLVGTPGAVVGAVVSTVAWRVAGRFGRRAVTVALLLVAGSTAASAALVAGAPAHLVVPGLVAVQVVGGVGTGLVHAPNQAFTLEAVPPDAAGLAAGFLQVLQRVSAVLALALLGGVVVSGSDPTAGPGADGRAAATGLVVCAAMTALSALASAVDSRARRRAGRLVVLEPAGPATEPATDLTTEPTTEPTTGPTTENSRGRQVPVPH
ncbi:MFS transporter [Cellulomonas palmilytica]|uniref:MFS transporter n=1 Tax=Cellulomonas palmilytica TaxID=2608402 RepID=UPI001F2E9FDD|nr:MFS transporter [Cellulomonas palmilytica]